MYTQDRVANIPTSRWFINTTCTLRTGVGNTLPGAIAHVELLSHTIVFSSALRIPVMVVNPNSIVTVLPLTVPDT